MIAARSPAVQLLRHAALALLCAAVHAAGPKTGTLQSTNTGLRPLGNGSFELGTVRLNKSARSVTFPATVNLIADLAVEYVVVHKTGKGHESIFTTTARPQDIHLALLLLDARPMMTNAFPQDLAIPPGGEKVGVEVAWKKDGREIRRAAEELVLDRQTGKPIPRGEWIFNGSNFSEGMFTAQRDGSIVSIHIDPDALVNNPRPGRDNDDRHAPNTTELPAVGTPVEITIQIGAQPKTP